MNSKKRIEIEDKIMKLELPQFELYQSNNESYFWGWHITLYQNRRFLLKLDLSSCYPDEIPSLYVIDPPVLRMRNGGTINALGSSHDFHTNQNGPHGVVNICHFHKNRWDASKTCIGVFYKGILWLEAYDIHLTVGKPIAELIDNIKRRQANG